MAASYLLCVCEIFLLELGLGLGLGVYLRFHFSLSVLLNQNFKNSMREKGEKNVKNICIVLLNICLMNRN